MASSIAAVMSTSPTSGALRIALGPSPSIAATMCLVTAFFDPRTWISPRSGPDGSTCQVSFTLTTVGGPAVGLRRLGRGRRRLVPAQPRPDQPVRRADDPDAAHGEAQRVGGDADVLQAGHEDHEGD